jgi:CDP-diglyceride synthetase
VSWLPTALGRPNLLGIASPVLGWVSVAVAVLLSVAVAVALAQLAGDLPRFRRFGTGYNYDHWPELLAGLARRL